MTFTPIGIASAALIVSCVAAVAQTVETAAGAQAIAVIGGSGGSRTQTLKTNPDAVAAPAMTTTNSCYVGEGSIALGSYLFGGVSGTRTVLDEGCEARADAAAFVSIAYARAELFGDDVGALRNLDLAERRMTATRAAFLAAATAAEQPWPELWRP
jgi:hypothetical protein